jgi:uncharacterized membrane protein YbhN (UPF0104 family)
MELGRFVMDWVSIVLASAVPIVLVGGLLQRVFYRRVDEGVTKTGLGIGWQFIRFTVLATGLPLVALLAVKGQLTGEVVAIYSAALGFAFGKSGRDD